MHYWRDGKTLCGSTEGLATTTGYGVACEECRVLLGGAYAPAEPQPPALDLEAVRHRVLGDHPAKEWHPLGEQEILALLAEVDRLRRVEFLWECADTPLMRDVMQERDEARQRLAELLEAAQAVVDVFRIPSGGVGWPARIAELRAVVAKHAPAEATR